MSPPMRWRGLEQTVKIDKAYVESLQGRISTEDHLRVTALFNGEVAALEAYNGEPTAANLRTWQAAKGALEAFLGDVDPASSGNGAGAMNSILAVTDFLNKDGWKVSKSKLSRDAQRGMIRKNADGTISEAEAIAYAHKYLKRAMVPDSESTEEMLRNKAEAEVALLRTREEKLRFEKEVSQGKYLRRDDVRLETAVKVGVLEAGLKNAVRIHADEWLQRAGGDASRAGLLCDLIYAEIDKLLDDFGNLPELGVVIRRRPEEVQP